MATIESEERLCSMEFTKDDLFEVLGLETNLTEEEIEKLIEETDWDEIKYAACRLFWKMAWESGEKLGLQMEE